MPTPRLSRSPDTYWSVAICFAAQATGRSASSITPQPIVIRSVNAAAAERTTVLSNIGALARTSPRIGWFGSGVEVGSRTPISSGMQTPTGVVVAVFPERRPQCPAMSPGVGDA